MLLVFPVSTSFSINFHVSTWLCVWMMSRLPLGSVGNLSWLPVGVSASFHPTTQRSPAA